MEREKSTGDIVLQTKLYRRTCSQSSRVVFGGFLDCFKLFFIVCGRNGTWLAICFRNQPAVVSSAEMLLHLTGCYNLLLLPGFEEQCDFHGEGLVCAVYAILYIQVLMEKNPNYVICTIALADWARKL